MDLRMTSHISPLRRLVKREILFITSIVHGLDAFDKKKKHYLNTSLHCPGPRDEFI